jgi:hypothetical protein
MNSENKTKLRRRDLPNTYYKLNSANIGLHVFVDTIARDYGLYLTFGHISILIFAKNRVEPVKEITLPIGARVTQHVSIAVTCNEITY